jgi:predicted nucleic acid-binding protein
MRLLDTSLLVDAFSGNRRSAPALTEWLADGNRVAVSTLVLYEYWRGPRTPREIDDVQELLTTALVVEFGRKEAEQSAVIYRAVGRVRRRDMDIAIAACALEHGAALWTLNRRDFMDIPGLTLI